MLKLGNKLLIQNIFYELLNYFCYLDGTQEIVIIDQTVKLFQSHKYYFS